MPEILLILAIALIVIGPKKLPELAKTLGKAMGEFKRSAQEFKRSIDVETTVNESVKDIKPPPAKDLKEVIKDVNQKEASASAPSPENSDDTDAPDETPDTDAEAPLNETEDAPDRDASFSTDTGDAPKK